MVKTGKDAGLVKLSEEQLEDFRGSPPDVYAWPLITLLCGDCGREMQLRFRPMEWEGNKEAGQVSHIVGSWKKTDHVAPRYFCVSEHCPRSYKVYELSTASAVILHEVAAAKPAVQHGVDCGKIGHVDEVQTRFDYFHAENSDGPFVSKRDGKTYCGRCHVAL